ncbi:hypothetical protein EC968_001228 [Mortierella alpina]|nr:hypothetical protein EC968_001228 [Mortierella alpina]
MSILKRSSKNKSASAASTPAQTPRSSMQEQRHPQATKMTREEVLEMLVQRQAKTPTAMSIFKRSNENKSASAASTPAQTPHSSLQEQRHPQTSKTTGEEVLEMLV